MTVRAIGVFALVLAMASPALAGPKNSVIGGKKLEQDMVHSAGAGYPSLFYEWWNKGKKKLDWGLSGELVYGTWGAADKKGRNLQIGFAVNGILRWHLAERKHPKVTNDVGFLLKPGLLIGRTKEDGFFGTDKNFVLGIKVEVGAPVSIDVHERVSVVVGGYVPFAFAYIPDSDNTAWIPLLVRMGVEIKANDNVAPWFFFDLGPGIRRIGGDTDQTKVRFAWRIGAGTAFWGVLGKNKNKSDSAATGMSKSIE